MSNREIILDTETTGLNPNQGHRIIEIGALEMVNKVLTGNSFHCYLNPERDIPEDSYKIHGISSEFFADKLLFNDKAKEFLQFIEDGTMVIHNAPFDIKFLNHELSLLNLPSIILSDVIDTLTLARQKFPGAKVNLNALCKRYKIDNSARTYHGALLDAYLLAEVYVELTGGRQSSFTMDTKIQSEDIFQEGDAVGNNLIIYPTPEELQAHRSFLKKIIKK